MVVVDIYDDFYQVMYARESVIKQRKATFNIYCELIMFLCNVFVMFDYISSFLFINTIAVLDSGHSLISGS